MSENIQCDVLVVGGGPGGYVAAIRAGQLGLSTVLVEKTRLGGTCLIRGCIPSKALIEAADQFYHAKQNADGANPMGISAGTPKLDFKKTISWKNGITDSLSGGVGALLKGAGVRVITGWAQFINAKTCHVGDIEIHAKNVVLATGSVTNELANFPIGGPVLSSTEALELDHVPQSLAVIGAGYIGVELGTAFLKFGTKVQFIEASDRILPGFDKALSAPVVREIKSLGGVIHTKARAKDITPKSGASVLAFLGKDGKVQKTQIENVLLTVGRKPCTQGWGLENMALDMDGPFVKVNNRCETPMRGVYAIGDLVGEPMLAHKASAQGEMVAEIIAGKRRAFTPAAIPAICYSDPEIVSVGLTKAQAQAQGMNVKTAKFRFGANGRALTLNAAHTGGFVEIIAEGVHERVVGLHGVGRHISELSGEFALALEMNATLEDIAGTIHAHPSLSETVMEAAMSALGHPLHQV